MTAELTGEGEITKDVKLYQKTAGWQSTIELPKDLDGRDSDPTAEGTATVAYDETTDKVTLSYK